MSEPDRRPLAERARPGRLGDLIGNARAVRELRSWAQAWRTSDRAPPRLRAVILEGPPGVGKTTAALAVAADEGWSVVEMNASDARNQDAIEEVAGRAAIAHTLGSSGTYRGPSEGGRTLILLDEADCLTGRASEDAAARASPVSFRDFLRGRYRAVETLASAWGLGRPGAPPAFERWEQVPATGGRGAWSRLPPAQRDLAEWKGSQKPRDTTDRGGLGAIARLVRETRQPLAVTVNDPTSLNRYSPVFRQQAARVRFRAVEPEEVKTLLRRTVLRERYAVSQPALEAIVRRSQGDLRAALNDLEAIAPLPPGPMQETVLGRRDIASDYYAFLADVFSEPRFYRSVETRDRLDVPPDDLLPWVEENLARAAPSAAARTAAFEEAARAEFLLARARRYRVYALWSFATEILTGGVSLALGRDPRRGPPDLAFPQFLAAMGQSRGARSLRLSISAKAGRTLHLSRRKAVEIALPLLERTLREGRAGARPGVLAQARALARALELTPDEVAYLLEVEPDRPEVLALTSPPAAAPAEPGPPKPSARRRKKAATAEAEPAAAPPEPPAAPAERRKVQRRLGEY